MGPGLLWGLRKYVERLGAARADSPPLAYNIQPVLIAGDASQLTTPLLAPTAIMGGVSNAVVAEFAACIINSAAPGGSFLTHFSSHSLGGGTTTNFRIFIGLTSASGAGVFTQQAIPTAMEMGPGPVKSFMQLGTTSAAFPATYPTYYNQAADTLQLNGIFYIPPGTAFIAQKIGGNSTAAWNAVVQDVEDVIPVA